LHIEMEWYRELQEKYPCLIGRGRPLYSQKDSPAVTSVETYQSGELLTYSLVTLGKYYSNRQVQKEANLNGTEIIMLHMVQQYGYDSLEDAEEKIRNQNMH